MIKPKKLYRYSNRELEKHELEDSCIPQTVERNCFGLLWRCRHTSSDHYGYHMRKSAKEEEILETRSRLGREMAWLDELTKDRAGKK